MTTSFVAMSSNLREQKRRATRAAIEDHATGLVLERGYDRVTIDDICAAANISRRTFFNYMESKDSAVLGPTPRPLTEEEIQRFASQQRKNLTEAVLELSFSLMTSATLNSANAAELMRRRKAIRRANPQLSATHLSSFAERQDTLISAVARYLENFADARVLGGIDTADEARLHVSVVTVAIHNGFKRWMKSPVAGISELQLMCEQALADIRTLMSERDAS